MFWDCRNCVAMEQSDYISEWQNLLLTLTSLLDKTEESAVRYENKRSYSGFFAFFRKRMAGETADFKKCLVAFLLIL